jgi:hypothetical protein
VLRVYDGEEVLGEVRAVVIEGSDIAIDWGRGLESFAVWSPATDGWVYADGGQSEEKLFFEPVDPTTLDAVFLNSDGAEHKLTAALLGFQSHYEEGLPNMWRDGGDDFGFLGPDGLWHLFTEPAPGYGVVTLHSSDRSLDTACTIIVPGVRSRLSPLAGRRAVSARP